MSAMPAYPVSNPSAAAQYEARSRFGHEFNRLGSSLLLGASSGAWAGFLIGGLLGRIAMFVLRLTSPDAVIGRKSDDGFTIGQISTETMFLIDVTTTLGALVGVAYMAARPAVPGRWMIAAWTIVGLAVGGSMILKADGIDFTELEPRLLSVAMFIAIPAGGAALMAVLIERRRAWWWKNGRRTALACIPLLAPTLLFVLPVAGLVALTIVAALATNTHIVRAATIAGPPLVRLGLVVVATWGGWNLIHDVTSIL
jgi:hypothetical protein